MSSSPEQEEGDVVWSESPDKFYCRTKKGTERFFQLRDRMDKVYYKNKDSLRIQGEQEARAENELCVWFEGSFWRAWRTDMEVEEEDGTSSYKLVDCGGTCRVTRRNVFRLTREFSSLCTTPALSFRCHLRGVVASVETPHIWSEEAVQFFAKETRNCPGVIVHKWGGPELMPDGERSLPVELLFRETRAECFRKEKQDTFQALKSRVKS